MRHPPTPFEREVAVRRFDRPLATSALPEQLSFCAMDRAPAPVIALERRRTAAA